MKVTLKIKRFNSEKDAQPWWGEYHLEAEPTDRLLDALTDPLASAVLCDLDEQGATRLSQPDPASLAAWLEQVRRNQRPRPRGRNRKRSSR